MILKVKFVEDERKMIPCFRQNEQKIISRFSENEKKIDPHFGEVTVATKIIGGEYYDGEYEAIPSPNEQVLKTAKRVMKNDVTITAIPYFDVSNNSGGSTVYIANAL